MNATITPEIVNGLTQYVLRDEHGNEIHTFGWMSSAALFALMEGYEVAL